MSQNEYLIYLIESPQKTKEGFSLGSQDLVISNIDKHINAQEAIGKIIVDDSFSLLIFKDRKYFAFIEKISKTFSIQNFSITVDSSLNMQITTPVVEKIEEEEQVKVEPQEAKLEPRIQRQLLQDVFVCPHLQVQESSFDEKIISDNMVKDMDRNDAYNCLFTDKYCPLKPMCMNTEFSHALSKFTNFENTDLYLLEFENHGKKHNLAINKTNMAVIPVEEN